MTDDFYVLNLLRFNNDIKPINELKYPRIEHIFS